MEYLITTKYLGPTGKRGARIRVVGAFGTTTFSFPEDGGDAHRSCAESYAKAQGKVGEVRELVFTGRASKRGRFFVLSV